MSSLFNFESEGNLKILVWLNRKLSGWFRTEEITMDYNLET